MTTNPDEQVKQAATSLAALRSEIRLKAHLASMEARTLWEDQVRPKLEVVEERLQRVLERGLRSAAEARVQAHLGLLEARDLWDALEPEVSEAIAKIRAELQDPGQADEIGPALRDLLQSTREAVQEATQEARDRAARQGS